jgi:glyoxalase family protein
MNLKGFHHLTAVTADAPGNHKFYTDTLGLRLVKKTVNQDDPTVYHLFYADENGSPGADLTFFEYPGARPGRAGAGMVHTLVFRVASEAALDFWEVRLGVEEVRVARTPGSIRFSDPEGLGLELAVVATADAPRVARHHEIPAEHAIQGFDAVRAYAHEPEQSRRFLEETLGFEPRDGADPEQAGAVTGARAVWEVRGASRGGLYAFDPAPATPGVNGAGTVHHVAWSTRMDEQEAWQAHVAGSGARPTPVIDRFWFRSIYFREPSGVVFELATMGPGFTTDEDLEHLGESLVLPPAFEQLRADIEPRLTPLPRIQRG